MYYIIVRAFIRYDIMFKVMFSGRMEVLIDKEGKVLGFVGSGGEGKRSF